jgi:hypothetical protein
LEIVPEKDAIQVWPFTKTYKLSSRFTDEYSFALFAEGLRAFSDYQNWREVKNLKTAIATFNKAVQEYPQDRIHYYYVGLIRLEQTSALPKLDSPAPLADDGRPTPETSIYKSRSDCLKKARQTYTDESVKSFERYQRDRGAGDDFWLYLWADYNRAAAYAHHLNPDGYLHARGILQSYLLQPSPVPVDHPIRMDLGAVSVVAGKARTSLFAKQQPLPKTLEESAQTKVVGVVAPKKDKPESRAASDKDGESVQEKLGNAPFAQKTFLLRVESLFMLTRARPLREAISLLNRERLGLERIDTVTNAVNALRNDVNLAHMTGRKKHRITDNSYNALESDLLDQLGHLDCARALELVHEGDLKRAVGQADTWGGTNFTIFMVLMNQLKKHSREWHAAQHHLEDAASFFEQSLKVQPGWIPAMKNLREVYLMLGRTKDAEQIQLPILIPPSLEVAANP